MDNLIIEKLSELMADGNGIESEVFINRWEERVRIILEKAIGKSEGDDFWAIKGEPFDRLAKGIGFLEGLVLSMKMEINQSGSLANRSQKPISKETKIEPNPVKQVTTENNVFIVHGHDNEVKEALARFIEKIGLEPIILHEQPNYGRTIIEKFERYSEVPFAIVLLTPDDIGCAKGSDNYQHRARQNVILELGYFMGKLGRERVCALYSEGVEIPSDYQGVLFIKLDKDGAWKTKIAQEFVEVNLPIKIEGLLK